MAVLCIVGAIGNALWLTAFNKEGVPFISLSKKEGESDIDEDGGFHWSKVFLTFLTFVIILQVIALEFCRYNFNDNFNKTLLIFKVMIPLSLYVTIELTKLMQIYHIQNDVELFDSETNKRIECRAMNIPEDLGQVIMIAYIILKVKIFNFFLL